MWCVAAWYLSHWAGVPVFHNSETPLAENSPSNESCLFLNPDIMICFQTDSLSSSKAFSILKPIKQTDNTHPWQDQEIKVQKERRESQLLAGQAFRLTFQ